LLTNSAIPGSAWTQVNAMNPLTGGTVPIFNEAAAYVSGVSPVLYQTNAPRSLVKNVYTGYETSVVARLPKGAFLIGGWTIDRQLDRSCAASAGSATTELGNPINDPNTLRFCDMFGGIDQALGAVPRPPWQNEFKLQASYPIRYGVVASASLYSNRYQGSFTPAGSSGVVANDGYLARTWTVTKSTRYPLDCAQCPAATDTTGSAAGLKAFVDPTMGQSSETLQLVAPGQVLTPRLNQVDVGFKRVFRFRDKYVLEPEAQIFNLLNSNAGSLRLRRYQRRLRRFLPGLPAAPPAPLKTAAWGARDDAD
jgi:hypothetical protein